MVHSEDHGDAHWNQTEMGAGMCGWCSYPSMRMWSMVKASMSVIDGSRMRFGRGAGFESQLLPRLIKVVAVEMSVPKGVHERVPTSNPVTWAVYVREEAVGCDVEWNAEEDISRPLVHLTMKSPAEDIELDERMAGHQGHGVEVIDVPCTDDDPAGGRILLDQPDGLGDLVVDAPITALPASPLLTIDGSEIPMLIRPLVPDADTVVLQVTDVGASFQEPEQLMDDAREDVNAS